MYIVQEGNKLMYSNRAAKEDLLKKSKYDEAMNVHLVYIKYR